MLGISLLQYLHRQSQGVWPGLSVEQFLRSSARFSSSSYSTHRSATRGRIVWPQCYPSRLLRNKLAESLGLEQLCSIQRG